MEIGLLCGSWQPEGDEEKKPRLCCPGFTGNDVTAYPFPKGSDLENGNQKVWKKKKAKSNYALSANIHNTIYNLSVKISTNNSRKVQYINT